MSFVRSAGCFLFSLLSMLKVLNVSAVNQFGCVAILDLYFSAHLLISSLNVAIPRSLCMSSFLTYHGAFTIVLRILACIASILFMWLIAAVLHMVFRTSRLVLWSFYIFLIYFLCLIWIFGLLASESIVAMSLQWRLTSFAKLCDFFLYGNSL